MMESPTQIDKCLAVFNVENSLFCVKLKICCLVSKTDFVINFFQLLLFSTVLQLYMMAHRGAQLLYK